MGKKCLKCLKNNSLNSCSNTMCFDCCSNSNKICSNHLELLKIKQEEDRYIEEAIRAKRKYRTFIHQETGFTSLNQTIVIWCLKDFCKNKSWSAATFAQLDRARLSNKLRMKRGLTNVRTNVNNKSFKKGLNPSKTRYNKLKQSWESKINENNNNSDSNNSFTTINLST